MYSASLIFPNGVKIMKKSWYGRSKRPDEKSYTIGWRKNYEIKS